MAPRDTVTPVWGHTENEDESNLKKKKETLPPTSLCHMLESYWCPQRARHLAALITNYRANQSLLAMEQLSALHSIGEEGTSNPWSSGSVPPKITTNASVVQHSYVKWRGTVISFLPNEPRSHYNATPSAKAGNCGSGFPPPAGTKRGFLSLHQFISMSFV